MLVNSRRTASVLAYFNRMSGGEIARAADAELLLRFAAWRESDAFAELVRRHGPMVLAVCRRILGNLHDAEDAFQATFLVLAARPHAVGSPASLASWLHGVAQRIALRAQVQAVRQRRRDLLGAKPEGVECSPDTAWHEERAVLDAEVARLPNRIREVFVLCCLEGFTHEEAGRRLGIPGGTVASRLSRARERLRDRLTRRGIGIGAVAASLAALEANAAEPAVALGGLVQAVTAHATSSFSAPGSLSPRVALLTQGVLKAMWMTKLKIAVAVVLAFGALGIGAGMVFTRAAQSGSGGPDQSTSSTSQPSATAPQQDRAAEVPNRGAPHNPAPRPTDALEKPRDAVPATVEDAQDEVDLMTARLDMKRAELKAAMVAAQRAEEVAARVKKETGAVGEPVVTRAQSAADEAMMQVQIKQAELREPEIRLRQARRRLDALRAAAAPPADKTPKDAAPKPSEAQDAVELAEAQVAIYRARLNEAKTEADAAVKTADQMRRLARANPASAAESAHADNQALTKAAQMEIRQAELAEAEVRLKHARRRAEEHDKAAPAATDSSRLDELQSKIDQLQKELDKLRKK
jgi:RNA polymerase sigma factor (sigma-70 family)